MDAETRLKKDLWLARWLGRGLLYVSGWRGLSDEVSDRLYGCSGQNQPSVRYK